MVDHNPMTNNSKISSNYTSMISHKSRFSLERKREISLDASRNEMKMLRGNLSNQT